MKILIRADGGGNIGMGHIMRTLALAKELKKHFDISYVCKTSGKNVEDKTYGKYFKGINKVLSSGFNIELVRENRLFHDLGDLTGDVLITDSYDVNDKYFSLVGDMFNKSIYIDDMCLHNFNDVDMIINQNINAEDLNYGTNAKLLLGCKYAMVRNEFKNVTAKNIKGNVYDIMITMGGTDPFFITLKLLDYLKNEHYKFHVVIGKYFDDSYIEKLKSYKNLGNIKFYYNADMCSLMKNADICISAAGSTLYELCAVGVPSLSIIMAKNQIEVAKRFDSLKIIRNVGWYNKLSKQKILAEINNLSFDYDMRRQVSIKSQKLVDGKGTFRITKEIMSIV
ncbi:UDP-2,4-diacetamido-2,4,6-trideoxy-beta-L-altropyranose hydrolase [Clostridium sp. CT7]|nr:UDP-2,4-diacetamido-2,4,6-trideoxy-beta-L-altropyranose hydrolase [Clostridium sp. CT7]